MNSISDESKASLRPKLRRFYDVFVTFLYRLGYCYMLHRYNSALKCEAILEKYNLKIYDKNLIIFGNILIFLH